MGKLGVSARVSAAGRRHPAPAALARGSGSAPRRAGAREEHVRARLRAQQSTGLGANPARERARHARHQALSSAERQERAMQQAAERKTEPTVRYDVSLLTEQDYYL